MNKILVFGLLLNIILYIVITLPIRIISLNKKIYGNNKKFILILIISLIYFVSISFMLYSLPLPHMFFSLFTKTSGIVNYGIYAFKILFLSSSLYSIKLLIPKYLVLVLKRFKYILTNSIKIQNLIKFPIDDLPLQNYV